MLPTFQSFSKRASLPGVPQWHFHAGCTDYATANPSVLETLETLHQPAVFQDSSCPVAVLCHHNSCLFPLITVCWFVKCKTQMLMNADETAIHNSSNTADISEPVNVIWQHCKSTVIRSSITFQISFFLVEGLLTLACHSMHNTYKARKVYCSQPKASCSELQIY